MNYEQKYNEVLQKAKEEYNRLGELGNESMKRRFEIIFPELAESEDERIRKAIIDALYSHTNSINVLSSKGYSMDDVVAYLEKQKEQKPEHFELKAGKWYICHRAFCCRADHLTVKEGERFMCEKDGIVKGFVIKEPEKYFKECSAPAPMEDEQKEQKPAEWNEDDELMRKRCVVDLGYLTEYEPQYKERYDAQINWLKSLRPSWKPSDEQMGAIRTAIDVLRGQVYDGKELYPGTSHVLTMMLNYFQANNNDTKV